MSLDGEKLGGVYVEITGDDAPLDAKFRKARAASEDLVRSMQAQFARNRLDIKTAKVIGDDHLVDRLSAANDRLQQKISLINAAMARQQGAAAGAAAGMGQASAATQAYAASLAAASGQLQKFNAMAATGAAATHQVHTGMAQIQGGARNAGMGLMLLAQTIDDAQYGFSAIVNNIPGVVMALTGSAGLGGAVAFAGIAVNTWVKNWDAAKDAFGDTTAFQGAASAIQSISDAALTAAASVMNLSKTSMTTGDIEAMAKDRAGKAARAKDAAKSGHDVSEIRSAEDQARAASFREAIEQSGGGDRLLKEIQGREIAGQGAKTKADQDKVRANVALAFGKALNGDEGAVAGLTANNARLGTAYAGVSPEAKAQAREDEAQDREDARQAEAERHDREEAARKAAESRKHLVEETARNMAALEKPILNNAATRIDDMVRDRLRKSGSDEGLAHEVAQKIRENAESRVTKESQETGAGRDETRRSLLARQMADEKAKADAEAKKDGRGDFRSERFGSTGDFMSSIQARIIDASGERNKGQDAIAANTKKANETLAEIAKNTRRDKARASAAARFGPSN